MIELLFLIVVGGGILVTLVIGALVLKAAFEVALVPLTLVGALLKGILLFLVLPVVLLLAAPILALLVGGIALVAVPVALCGLVLWAGCAFCAAL